jgi:hypothetical protein
MEKKILILCAGLAGLLTACYSGADDHKNEVEPYPTYDTNSKMENINSTGTHLDSVRLKEVK